MALNFSIDLNPATWLFDLTIEGNTVASFASYFDADAAMERRKASPQYIKQVKVTRDGRTIEYDCYLDGEYVGSRRTRIEADQYLDRLVHDRLSGRLLVEGR